MKTITPDGRFTVSTIPADGLLARFPETCIFDNRPCGSSHVVTTYDTFADAVADHPRIVADCENIFNKWEDYYRD